MKKILLVIIGVMFILFGISLLHLEKTEWVLKEKIYNLNIPVNIIDGTIAEIEEQAKKVLPSKYSTAYLSEIKFTTKSKDGFEKFSDGILEFIYCDNLGTLSGFYKYDRYALCKISIDLQQHLITEVKVYGNNQIGGLNKLEIYPDIKEIQETIYTYCKKNTSLTEDYTIMGCFIDIIRADIIMSSFTVKLSNETQRQIHGKIVKINGTYMFLEQ